MSENSASGLNSIEEKSVAAVLRQIGNVLGDEALLEEGEEELSQGQEVVGGVETSKPLEGNVERFRRLMAAMHEPWWHEGLGGASWERKGKDEKIELTETMMEWLVKAGSPNEVFSIKDQAKAKDISKEDFAKLTIAERDDLLDKDGKVSARDVAVRVARHLYFGGSEKGLSFWGLKNQTSGEVIYGTEKKAVVEAIKNILDKDDGKDYLIFVTAHEFHELYFGVLKNLQYVQGDLREEMGEGYYIPDEEYHKIWVEMLAEEQTESGFMVEVEKVEKNQKVSLGEAMRIVRQERRVATPKFTWFAPERNNYGQAEPHRLWEDRFFDPLKKRGSVKMMWDARERVRVTEVKKWVKVAEKHDGKRLEQIKDESEREITEKVRRAVMRAVEFRGGLDNGEQLDVDKVRLKVEVNRKKVEVRYRCRDDDKFVVEMSDWNRQLVVMLRAAAIIPRVYKKDIARAVVPLNNGEGATVIFDVDRKAPWSDRVPWVKDRGLTNEGEQKVEVLDRAQMEAKEALEDAKWDMYWNLRQDAREKGKTLGEFLEEVEEGRAWIEDEVNERVFRMARDRKVKLSDETGKEKSMEALIGEMPLQAKRKASGDLERDEQGEVVMETREGILGELRMKVKQEMDNLAIDEEFNLKAAELAKKSGGEMTQENAAEWGEKLALSQGYKDDKDETSGKVTLDKVAKMKRDLGRQLGSKPKRRWFWAVELKPLEGATSEGSKFRRARWNKCYDILQMPTWLESRRKGESGTFGQYIENEVRKAQAARSEGMYKLRMLMNTALTVFEIGEGDKAVYNEEFGFALNFVRRQPDKTEALLSPDLVFPREVANQYNEAVYGMVRAEPGFYRLQALLRANYAAGTVPYSAQRAEEVSLHTGSVPEMVLRVNEFIKRRWLLTKSIEHPLLAKILQRGKEGMNELIRLEKLCRMGGLVELERLRQCGMTIMGWDQIRDTKPWQKAIFWRMHLDRDQLYALLHDYGSLTDEEVPFRNWSRDKLGDFLYILATEKLDETGREVLRKWQINVDRIRAGEKTRREIEDFTKDEVEWFLKFDNELMLKAVDRVQRVEAEALRDDLIRILARDPRVGLTRTEREVLDPRGHSDTAAPNVLGEKINYEVWLNNMLSRVVERGRLGYILVDDAMLTEEELAVLNPAVEKVGELSFRERLNRREELLSVIADPKRTKTVVSFSVGVKISEPGVWVRLRKGEVGGDERYRGLRQLNDVEMGGLDVRGRERLVAEKLASVRGEVLGGIDRASRYRELAMNDFAGIREILLGRRTRMQLTFPPQRGTEDFEYYENWFRPMFESPRGGAAMYHKWMPFIGLENPSDVMAVMDWVVKNRYKVYGVKFNGEVAAELKEMVKNKKVEENAVRILEDESVVFYPMYGFGALNFMELRLEHWVGLGRGRGGGYKEIGKEKREKAERYLRIAKTLLAKQGVIEPEEITIPNKPGILATFVGQMGDEWSSEQGEYVPTFKNRVVADASEGNGFWGNVMFHLAFGDMSYDPEWLKSIRWDAPDTLAAVYDRVTFLIADLIKIDEDRLRIRFDKEKDHEVALRTPSAFELGAGLGEKSQPSILSGLLWGWNIGVEINGREYNFGLRRLAYALREIGWRMGQPITSHLRGLEYLGWDDVVVEAVGRLVAATEEDAFLYRMIKFDQGLKGEAEEGVGSPEANKLSADILSKIPILGTGWGGVLKDQALRLFYGQTVRAGVIAGMMGAIPGGVAGAGLGFSLAVGSVGVGWGLGVAGVTGLLGGGLVGTLSGLVFIPVWHGARVLFGKYRRYYSEGWPVPLQGWSMDLPLLGHVRLLGDKLPWDNVHTSAIDTTKNAQATAEAAAGRMF